MTAEQPIQQHDPEALGFVWAEWRPSKLMIGKNHLGFTILRSLPDSSTLGAIQFSVRRQGFGDDILRADSYIEGYFAVSWHTDVNLAFFLTAAENFLTEFESAPSNPIPDDQLDESHTLTVLKSNSNDEIYAFGRPLTEKELLQHGVFTEETRPLVNLVRLDTPYAAFFYQGNEKRVGIIATINDKNKDKLIQTTATLVNHTQPVLTPAIVTNVLNRLPYLSSDN